MFPQYPEPYFAAFSHDPARFTIEAVCHHDPVGDRRTLNGSALLSPHYVVDDLSGDAERE